MSELNGTFGAVTIVKRDCRKCKYPELKEEMWDSSCGGYTDYKYTCPKCGHYYWIEGPDS